jgi:hypothetical protein
MKKLFILVFILIGITVFAEDVLFEDLTEEQKQEVIAELYLKQATKKEKKDHESNYRWNSKVRIIDKLQVPNDNYLYIVEIRGQYFIVDPYRDGPSDAYWGSRITPLK